MLGVRRLLLFLRLQGIRSYLGLLIPADSESGFQNSTSNREANHQMANSDLITFHMMASYHYLANGMRVGCHSSRSS